MNDKQRKAATRQKAVDTKFAQELCAATQITNTWSRVQALAMVIKSAPESEVRCVVEMAFKAARESKDAYQRVAVTAWVLYALVKRGQESVAAKYLPDILADAHRIMPAPSQVEALWSVWNALGPDSKLGSLALAALVSACDTANTWRAGRIMRAVVTIVARSDRPGAEALWATMPENRYKRQTRRMLDAGQAEITRSY